MRHIRARQNRDPILLWLIGATVGLAVLFAALGAIWGRGQVVVQLTWFSPMVNSFMALASLSIAFLSLGRYRALRDPAPFWVGIGFIGFAVFALFYVLSLPDLFPGGGGLVASLLNTSSWFWHLQFSVLFLGVLAALLLPWPSPGPAAERWWLPTILLAAAGLILLSWLLAVYERSLPPLLTGEAWNSLNVAWNSILVPGFAVESLLSARRYRLSDERLFGYLAIALSFLAFAILTVIIGLKFYDQWWYLQRGLWIVSFSVILFGLLAEYVGLFTRERDRSRQLEAILRVTDPALAQRGHQELLQGILERTAEILGADGGAILLLDPLRDELQLAKATGITRRLGEVRVKVGQGLAGQVAARNAPYWVRDAQQEPAAWGSYIGESHIRAVIGAPMRIGRQVIGVIELEFLSARSFTPFEERLLEVGAERAALAIEQERLLDEAQRERARLQVLIDTAPVGIILYSAPDFPRPVLFNKAAEAILGRPLLPEVGLAEAAAHYEITLPSGEPLPPDRLPAACALRGETCLGQELMIRQPSGRRAYVLANSAPLRDAKGAIVGAVVTLQDITALKEQELLRDEFISAAAHELKTPITTIKGYAQLMGQWAPGGHEPREGKAIQVINAQADRLTRRVQEMLEVVRLRTAPPELRKSRFDLGDLAEEVIPRVQVATKIHQLVLQRDSPALVEADRERIEEVLVSLLDNAIKYSPNGGEIRVRVWSEDGQALLSVQDHGVGIPRDRQPHIFEPFYEAVPPGTPGYHGVVALSLYLSKLTVERHGGRLWFASEEGKGSTFFLSLPLAQNGNGRG